MAKNLSKVPIYEQEQHSESENHQTSKCAKPLSILVITMFVYPRFIPQRNYPALLKRERKTLKVEIRHTFQAGPRTMHDTELFP